MEKEFDHAGNVETSIMLAISKNVNMKKAKKGFQTDGMSKQEIFKDKQIGTEIISKSNRKWSLG